jgi:secondary thiamine-phosphate synthase enzyme
LQNLTLRIQTTRRDEFIDLTGRIHKLLAAAGVREGLCLVYIPHTTAGVTINERADADVVRDLQASLDRQVPWRDNYRHGEGNSAAHIKASLLGASVTVPIQEGRLTLGTWQGIFFAEFDGPRNRSVHVVIYP